MPRDVKSKSSPGPEAERLIQLGATRGGESTKQEFDRHITRRRFCEEVGIHRTTLRKWERLGIVSPKFVDVLNSRTAVFEKKDVERGKKITALLAEEHGAMSLAQAAAAIDGR